MKNRIETPMYVTPGFVDGLEKQFPEGSSRHDQITNTKRQVTQFLRDAGTSIKQIESVRKANQEDPTQTQSARAVNTFKFAEKQFGKIHKRMESLPSISLVMQDLQSEMDATMAERAKSPFASEARARIASMPEAERASFISKRMQGEDIETAAYALGAPAFLSGLSDEQHKTLKNHYQNTVFSAEMDAMKALDSLNIHTQKAIKSTSQVFSNIEAQAQLKGALDKSERAQKLMDTPA